MHNLEKYVAEEYLKQDEKELFELILYHRKQYQNTKAQQDGLHPDDIAIMKILDQGNQLLIAILEERKNRIIAKQKPTLTNCPECNIEKERNPIAEEKSEHGYMCNKYRCDECKIEYLDFNPNNAKDQLRWFNEFSAVLEKHKKELEKLPDEQKKDVWALKEQGEKFKKACEAEEEALKNLQQAEQKRDKAIAQWRDYLLVAKIKGQWGNPPAAIN